MGSAMKQLSGCKITNVVKLVNNWQHDGHQKHVHMRGEDSPGCPACNDPEEHMHFIQCKSEVMQTNHRHRRDDFLCSHNKLKMAGIIMRGFKTILQSLQDGNSVPSMPPTSHDIIGQLFSEAWDEQEKIGWAQVLKGRLSIKWRHAQQEFYKNNPATHGNDRYNGELWMVRTIHSFLNFSLGLWKDRCEVLHGIEHKDKKSKEREKLQQQIQKYYSQRDEVDADHQDIFEIPVDELLRRNSLQTLHSWIQSYHTDVSFTTRNKQMESLLVRQFAKLAILN